MGRYDNMAVKLSGSAKDLCRDLMASDLVELIQQAEQDICLYLRRKAPLSDEYESKIISLAKIKLLKSKAKKGIKSLSYTEGSVSKSETYLTAEDYDKQETELLNSLAAYRRARIVK